jgi:predicted metal-dependent phosphoesterase TrpH
LSVHSKSGKHWMKAELHSHCSLDPVDYRICNHTPEELIYKAAELGYEILAVTCHNKDIWTEELSDYAGDLGVTLIPGMEVITERTRHTLVYNFRADAEDLNSLKKIRARSREDTLVIAPHPYFPGRICLRDLLEMNLDSFDAIECSGFQVRHFDFNRRAEKLAARTQKPLVGNADIHYLWQLDRTFTWIYSEPGVLPVLHAVKQGSVRVQKSPLTWFEAAQWWATSLWRYAFPVNPSPDRTVPGLSFPSRPSDKVEDGRCFGPAQESMEP